MNKKEKTNIIKKIFIKKEERMRRKDKIEKKESFMQGVAAMMLSQILIKLLGLVYNWYLTVKPRFWR